MTTDIKKQSFLETYEIKEQLGAGSGGTIIKAYHKNLQKDVVLKKMHDSAAEVLSRRSETDALKNLRHPYIPQVLDFIELDDGIYTVMDFIPGKSFGELIKDGRRFSQKEAIKYARQLFEALTYIHSQKPAIIHGDIKPDNVMLTPDDNICLIDFNISGSADETGALIEGFSDAYSSPEQKAGFLKFKEEAEKAMSKNVAGTTAKDGTNEATSFSDTLQTLRTTHMPDVKIDERADIYSAAATIYHILTGQKPELQNGTIIPAKTVDKNVSEAFSFVLGHAMEQDPEKRYQTSADALKAINDMHKLDSRYRALVWQQNLLFVVAVLFISIGAVLIVRGRNLTALEHNATYASNVERMEEIAMTVDSADSPLDQEMAKLYEECLAINDKELDAYRLQATYLFRKRDFDGALEYIDKNIFENVGFTGQSGMEVVYYIYGSSLVNGSYKDYQDGITYFEKAIDAGNTDPSCYRELAECYLSLGDPGSAEVTLDNAGKSGITGPDMELLAGEISLAKGDASGAQEHYKKSIEMALQADDMDVLLRSYLGLNDAVLGGGRTEQSLNEAIEVLDKALDDLPGEYQIQVIQSQVQNYVDAYQLTGYRPYIQSGIDLLERAIGNGWKDYSNYVTLAFFYEQNGDYDKAKEILEKLTAENPENYVAYKRLAYLEADYMATLPVSSRDYSEFKTYYDTAKEKYAAQGNPAGDLEMDYLDQMYSDVEAQGWLR